ncbi:Protein of unknown function [Propionibacterium freudenreichii]|nr:Protein of unknown function [Propionibacterium freudenreichii]
MARLEWLLSLSGQLCGNDAAQVSTY